MWGKVISSPHSNPLTIALAMPLRRIETLAALLGVLSDRRPCEPPDAEMVAEAAGIAEETARLRAAIGRHLHPRE